RNAVRATPGARAPITAMTSGIASTAIRIITPTVMPDVPSFRFSRATTIGSRSTAAISQSSSPTTTTNTNAYNTSSSRFGSNGYDSKANTTSGVANNGPTSSLLISTNSLETHRRSSLAFSGVTPIVLILVSSRLSDTRSVAGLLDSSTTRPT